MKIEMGKEGTNEDINLVKNSKDEKIKNKIENKLLIKKIADKNKKALTSILKTI